MERKFHRPHPSTDIPLARPHLWFNRERSEHDKYTVEVHNAPGQRFWQHYYPPNNIANS